MTPQSPYWTKYDALFKKYGTQYNIPWQWLKAIAINESDLGQDPRVRLGAVSRDGKSWGIMQLTLPTAQDLFGPALTAEDLNFPYISIQLAAKYLAQLSRLFKGDLQDIVMSYNQGPGNTLKGYESPGVIQYWEEFQKYLSMIG